MSLERFCDLVKHRCRYIFLEEGRRERESGEPGVIVGISSILPILKNLFIKEGLISVIPRNSILYRARYYNPRIPFKLNLENFSALQKEGW